MTGKRFGSLFLALAWAMSMTACGGGTAPEDPEPIPEEPNVEVIAFEGLLVNAVKDLKADAILRGLRAFSDFEYELQMALMNRELLKGCETIFLTPQLENSYVSSTLIKEVARLGADFAAHVPPPVARALNERRNRL